MCPIKLQKQAAANSPISAGLLLRLVGLGGGTGGCLAWGGTGGGTSGSAGEVRGVSSTIRETVLGGLATATGAEEDEEEEEEDEEDEEEEAGGLLPDSVEGAVSSLGGSRACLGGGSCWESCAGCSGAKRTPADSTDA